MDNIIKYNRVQGVPKSHHMLMKIDCFGEMGGPYYSDRILYHSDSKDDLIDFCKSKNIELNDPNGWNEYFISVNK